MTEEERRPKRVSERKIHRDGEREQSKERKRKK